MIRKILAILLGFGIIGFGLISSGMSRGYRNHEEGLNRAAYLFYHDGGKSLDVELEEEEEFYQRESICLYQGEELAGENIILGYQPQDKGKVRIELREYLESFNRILIEKDGEENYADLRQYYLEEIEETFQDEELESVKIMSTSAKQDGGEYIGTFRFQGDRSWDMRCIIPKKAEDILSEFDFSENSKDESGDIREYELKMVLKEGVQDIYIEIIILQSSKERGENAIKIDSIISFTQEKNFVIQLK